MGRASGRAGRALATSLPVRVTGLVMEVGVLASASVLGVLSGASSLMAARAELGIRLAAIDATRVVPETWRRLRTGASHAALLVGVMVLTRALRDRNDLRKTSRRRNNNRTTTTSTTTTTTTTTTTITTIPITTYNRRLHPKGPFWTTRAAS